MRGTLESREFEESWVLVEVGKRLAPIPDSDSGGGALRSALGSAGSREDAPCHGADCGGGGGGGVDAAALASGSLAAFAGQTGELVARAFARGHRGAALLQRLAGSAGALGAAEAEAAAREPVKELDDGRGSKMFATILLFVILLILLGVVAFLKSTAGQQLLDHIGSKSTAEESAPPTAPEALEAPVAKTRTAPEVKVGPPPGPPPEQPPCMLRAESAGLGLKKVQAPHHLGAPPPADPGSKATASLPLRGRLDTAGAAHSNSRSPCNSAGGHGDELAGGRSPSRSRPPCLSYGHDGDFMVPSVSHGHGLVVPSSPGGRQRSASPAIGSPRSPRSPRPDARAERFHTGDEPEMGRKNTGPVSLRWMAGDKAQSLYCPAEHEAVDPIAPPWSPEEVARVLGSHDIPVEKWTQEAKEILNQELCDGRARLRFRGKPTRAVELVLLVVEYPAGRCLLQEAARRGNRFSPLPEKTPATRISANEDLFVAAQRLLNKKVHIPANAVKVHHELISVTDTTENTDFFPGLPSVVRKFLVRVEVVPANQAAIKAMGLPSGPLAGREDTGYRWVPQESAFGLLKHLKTGGGLHSRATNRGSRLANKSLNRTLMDDKVKGLLPWTLEAVTRTCATYGVSNPEQEFGTPLPSLVAELVDGFSFLAVRRTDGKLFCVCDAVSLAVETASGAVLVMGSTLSDESGDAEGDSAGAAASKPELPKVQRLADEGIVAAARRAAKLELNIAHHEMICDVKPAEEAEEPAKWPFEEDEVPSWATGKRPPGRWLRHFVVRAQAPASAIAAMGISMDGDA